MYRFVVSTEKVTINAPAAFVWEVLTDFENYPAWNPFTPEARTTLELGSPANLLVRMWPRHQKITETVRAVEPPHLLSWQKAFSHKSVLFAVREQRIETHSKVSSTYHNLDILTGLIAPIIGPLFNSYMKKGFEDVGVAVKQRVESLYAAEQASV